MILLWEIYVYQDKDEDYILLSWYIHWNQWDIFCHRIRDKHLQSFVTLEYPLHSFLYNFQYFSILKVYNQHHYTFLGISPFLFGIFRNCFLISRSVLSLFPHIHAHNLHYMFPMISIETICSFLRNLFGDNCEQLKIIIQKCRTWNSKFDWLCKWNIGKVVKWRKLKKMT